jgi:hypothetical protein
MKFRQLFTFILLISAVSAVAQEEHKPEVPKFAIGVNFSPSCAYRYLHITDEGSSSGKLIKDLLNEYYKPKFGYTTGLDFSWFASRRLTLETGLWFSDKGFQSKWISTETAVGQTNPYEKARLLFTSGYLSVPLKLNFNIITTPVTFFISAGMSADLLLYAKNKVFLVYESGEKETLTINERSGLRDLNVSYIGSLGVEYGFLKNFRVRLEPTFMMTILPVYSGEIKNYLWTLGGNVGIYYVVK